MDGNAGAAGAVWRARAVAEGVRPASRGEQRRTQGDAVRRVCRGRKRELSLLAAGGQGAGLAIYGAEGLTTIEARRRTGVVGALVLVRCASEQWLRARG